MMEGQGLKPKLKLDLDNRCEFQPGNDMIQTPPTPAMYVPTCSVQQPDSTGFSPIAAVMDSSRHDKAGSEHVKDSSTAEVPRSCEINMECGDLGCNCDRESRNTDSLLSESRQHTETSSGTCDNPARAARGTNNCGYDDTPASSSGCRRCDGGRFETTVYMDRGSTSTWLSRRSDPDKRGDCLTKRKRCYVRWTVGVCVVILLMVLAGLVAMGYADYSRKDDVRGFCVRCRDLPEASVALMERRGDFCCAVTSQQMELLMESRAEGQPRVDYRTHSGAPRGHGGEPAVVINKNGTNIYVTTLRLATVTAESPRRLPIEEEQLDMRVTEVEVGWSVNDDTAAKGQGFDYEYDSDRSDVIKRVVITASGKYNVYLRATVKGYRDDDEGHAPHLLYAQAVMRQSHTRPQPLLREQRYMTCPTGVDTSVGCNTVETHGLLHLRRGDKLYVKVSHPRRLVPAGTSFSLVKL